ncbi:ACT-domain-containing protein, predicted allosteric regulator of homoserine dehydrogenase [Archaeoglobus sulfaticallidus PM70-1]|uniref:ACT-domain-containing protein, predicted allosteric regulator of homoserine dehydrogenase n=1 Tax=Archaeoglobus sulfaticallidus PM70-1 TaxID=387631 RepID=N0BF40_9EURY|nr:ACT domain-containing protein [Archaeoglobus sulfaticallidus]AGK61638.1 ACT-domain-containing protein, predicted allosteric regulator of homoserine dehydrogenase [Archaeoglobus sulfaticallidus PM70-1]
MPVISIVVELEDKPGQLLKALEPISREGGNILSIIHQRDKKTPLQRVPVEISFDAKNLEIANRIIEALKESGVLVKRYNEIRLIATTSLMIIGHIVKTDLSDTINRIDSTGFAEVVDLQINMPEVNKPSTAMITISATGKDELEEAVEIMRNVCRSKNLLLIEPINENFS